MMVLNDNAVDTCRERPCARGLCEPTCHERPLLLLVAGVGVTWIGIGAAWARRITHTRSEPWNVNQCHLLRVCWIVPGGAVRLIPPLQITKVTDRALRLLAPSLNDGDHTHVPCAVVTARRRV